VSRYFFISSTAAFAILSSSSCSTAINVTTRSSNRTLDMEIFSSASLISLDMGSYSMKSE
jgi:hypothetical protein